LSQESQRWGVETVRVTLDKITLPEEVRQRMIEAWDVTWHDVVDMARALTEAKAITARAIGAGQAARVKAVNEARARLEAVGIDSLAKLLEARGEAAAELEAAKVKAQRTVIESQAKADAQMIEGRAKAVAEAERFREVLFSLQRDFSVDEKTLSAVIIRLVGVFTDVTDLQALVRFLAGGRSLVAGTVPAQIEGGDGASPGPG
jgi:regulator of protease activity HflC (stomatin/prohibitin superfamily)